MGIRNNNELIEGYYNHSDSYYDYIGKKAVENYFKNEKPNPIYNLIDGETDTYKKNNLNMDFLQDGLFCEYAYVYNQENDTLEIYRGFFKSQQNFELEME